MRPTMILALLASLGACQSVDPYPPLGGGGPGMGTGTEGDDPPDAGGVADAMPGLDGQDAPAAIAGQLCRVDDVRFPLACPSSTSLAGIAVRELGSDDLDGVVTSDTGAFSLERTPDGRAETSLDVAREHADFIPALAAVALDEAGGAADVRVPLVPRPTWESLLGALAADPPDGSATLLVFVRNAGQPVAGADVIAPQGTPTLPFFDDGGPESFVQGGLTGDRGTAIVLGAPAGGGVVDFSILPPGGQAIDFSGVPVAPNAITLVNADLADL